MSGSGTTTFSDYTASNTSCETLVFETQLASPKDDVIDQLSPGDELDVVAVQIGGLTVVQVIWNGQVAGGIASPKVQRLLVCIQQGTMYVAKVMSRHDGQVKFVILPVKG